MNKVLIVEDNIIEMLGISDNLKEYGLSTIEASSGRSAIKYFKKENPSLVLLDLQMPGMDGIETMQELKKMDPDVPIIIFTAYGDIPTAVEAIQLGAYDFIVKPPDFERLTHIIKRASEKYLLDRKVKSLNNEVETSLQYLCGKSEAMKKIIRQIHQISQSDVSLIIQGETGVGKSYIARYIHHLSKRAAGPFVSVDIGAIPEALVESELFGHEKGAFTGAERNKDGFFKCADKGTILLDELQNLSPYVQSKLLTAVDEKNFHPLGSTHPLKTDVRIIGATNTDIIYAVKTKNFRADLFYRLSEFMIHIPPLRERREDISFFIDKFVREGAEDHNKRIMEISKDAMDLLMEYSWPGNIRELKNVVRRAVLLAEQGTIRPEHIEFLINSHGPRAENENTPAVNESPCLSIDEIEKRSIKQALCITKGNKKEAALMLNIGYTTLFRKLKQYGL